MTSRELLRIRGEAEYPVPPLGEQEAVELFCARSRLEAADAIAELCRRLDNLPLAVELAAARTSVLSPAQILDRLSQRLDLLRAGRDVEDRQQTLRAAIEWSYDLLPPAEASLFQRLSLFVGGCSLAAAEVVCEADLDTLQSLVDKSLVRHRAERFWMLETIREYAAGRLERSGARESMCERYADWVVAEVSRGAESHWGRTPEEWYTRVETEVDNVRAALDWLEAAGDGERFARICIAMRGHWFLRGSLAEGAARLERALTLAVPDRMRPGLLIGVAWLARGRMDVPRFRSAAEELVEFAEAHGDHNAMVAGLRDLGVAAGLEGDTELARSHWRVALALAREHDLQAYLPPLTGNLAAAELQRRNWKAARDLAAEAAQLADRSGDAQTGAISRLNQGTATILGGDPAAARRPLVEALEISVGRGWSFVSHDVLDALASVVMAEGDPERAARLMGAAEALRENGGLASEQLEEEQRRLTRGRLQQMLGDRLFEDAYAAGRTLTLTEAAALAQR